MHGTAIGWGVININEHTTNLIVASSLNNSLSAIEVLSTGAAVNALLRGGVFACSSGFWEMMTLVEPSFLRLRALITFQLG